MMTIKKGLLTKPSDRKTAMRDAQGLYSPTILKNVLCLVLQIFRYLAAFECNRTSDWLTHTG